jgi:hypothetical protein
MNTLEYSRPQFHEGSPSPFLTDRETAQLTATAVMGPLAIAAFDTRPSLGLGSPEAPAFQPEVPDTIDKIDGFSHAELLTAMRQQQRVADAAIMFATREFN